VKHKGALTGTMPDATSAPLTFSVTLSRPAGLRLGSEIFPLQTIDLVGRQTVCFLCRPFGDYPKEDKK